MNMYEVAFADFPDFISEANVLVKWETDGGFTIRVAEYAGVDALIIQDLLTGGGLVIEANDIPYGGSVHELARSVLRRGTL